MLLAAAEPGTGPPIVYNSSTGVEYCLNLAWLKQPDAEARCVQQCGHLTYFSSAAEQEEVEGWYIAQVGGQDAPHVQQASNRPAAMQPFACRFQRL